MRAHPSTHTHTRMCSAHCAHTQPLHVIDRELPCLCVRCLWCAQGRLAGDKALKDLDISAVCVLCAGTPGRSQGVDDHACLGFLCVVRAGAPGRGRGTGAGRTSQGGGSGGGAGRRAGWCPHMSARSCVYIRTNMFRSTHPHAQGHSAGTGTHRHTHT